MQRPELKGLARSFSIVYDLDKRGEHELAADVFLAMTAGIETRKIITADFELSAEVLKRLMQHGYIFSMAFIFQALSTILRLGYESGKLLKNVLDFPIRELASYSWELLQGKSRGSSLKISASIGLILGTVAAVAFVGYRIYKLLKRLDAAVAAKWKKFMQRVRGSKVVSKATAAKFWLSLTDVERQELLGATVAVAYEIVETEEVTQ